MKAHRSPPLRRDRGALYCKVRLWESLPPTWTLGHRSVPKTGRRARAMAPMAFNGGGQ